MAELKTQRKEGTTMTEYTLPDLPYDYNALEPHFDEQTMTIHHTKHHQGYTNKLNAALADSSDWQGKPAEELLQNLDALPAEIRIAVRNNGGGFVNHSLFWPSLLPGGSEPAGALLDDIESTFGSFDEFKDAFTKAASTVFGSGWAWLVLDGGSLKIVATPNQDSPYTAGQTPLLGLDVWEHAYYLKYQNKRPDYISAFWNIVNWPVVAERYEAAK